jgi:hypothetical protein
MVRDLQLALLRWVLDAVGGEPPGEPLPDMELAVLHEVGLTSGLSAIVGAIAERDGLQLPAHWQDFIDEQRAVVAERHRRYMQELPVVLQVLHAAGVRAVPVKGAVIAERWPLAGSRPMADLDLLVHPGERNGALAALRAAGYVVADQSPLEDIVLLWGDGSTGDSTRESLSHSGKLELHPGWQEHLHNYTVADTAGTIIGAARPDWCAGVPADTLPQTMLSVHALGHLAACVVRAEVRAVNVVDLVILLSSMSEAEVDEVDVVAGSLDLRLVAPALWLLREVWPSWASGTGHGVEALAGTHLQRLPHAATRALEAAGPADVLRLKGSRTSVRWRLAFARSIAERAAVLRQAAWPTRAELAHDEPDVAVWRLHLRRIRRGLRRVTRRMAR